MAKTKKTLNKTAFSYLIKQVAIAGISFIALLLLSLFLVNIYTKHGKQQLVPEIRGLAIEEAIQTLKEHGLHAEIIDSMYVKTKTLGTIIEQNPAPHSIVKPGRQVYLIINSQSVRQVSFPHMRDISLRQAQAVARSIGFNIASIQYVTSEYRDLVLDVTYKGKSLTTGDKIPEDSSIVLVVGDGYGASIQSGTPYLIGFDLHTATDIIMRAGMYVGNVNFETPPSGDEAEYIVFQQFPEAGDYPTEDSIIHIFLSKDFGRFGGEATDIPVTPSKPVEKPKKEEKKEKVKDIEDFF